MLSKTEIAALARSANVAPDVVRDWLDGEPAPTPEIGARLARVYRALRFGAAPSPAAPIAAITARGGLSL